MATIYEDVETLKTQMTAVQTTLTSLQNTVATLQEKTNDSGWLTLPLADGIQPYGGAPQYRKIGKIVTIRGAIKNVLGTGVVATLPAGYRPTYSVPYVQNTSLRTGNFAMFTRMIAGTDGGIRVEAISDGAVFAADKWFPLNCVFAVD